MISIALVLTVAIFLIIALLFGMNRAIAALPALFFYNVTNFFFWIYSSTVFSNYSNIFSY